MLLAGLRKDVYIPLKSILRLYREGDYMISSSIYTNEDLGKYPEGIQESPGISYEQGFYTDGTRHICH